MSFISEIDNLKIIYKEIIDGYSQTDVPNLIVRHLTEIENIEVVNHKNLIYNHHIKNRVPSLEDKLKTLIENGEWSQTKEDDILNLNYEITDNERNVKRIIPAQQAPILKMIEASKVKLTGLLMDKQRLIRETANSFAERDSFNYMIFLSLYKKIDERLFKHYSDFEELENEEIIEYGAILEKTMDKFTHATLSQIACMPFFINPFSYSKDNIYFFIKKPLSELTHYQSALFSLGSRNLSILNNTEAEPPEVLPDTKLNDIAIWYDKSYQLLLTKKNTTSTS